MARLQIHPVGLIVVIFGLLAWVIALGGCGAASYNCQKSNSYAECALEYQWEWWSLWFEFALLVSLFVVCFLESAFKRGQLTLLAFFLLATMCCMIACHNFITHMVFGPIDIKDLNQDATQAAGAGFVLLSLTNFVLIIILSKDFGAEAHKGPRYDMMAPPMVQFQSSAPV